jgi:hypothetical protein
MERAGYLQDVRVRLGEALALRRAVVEEAFGGSSELQPTHRDETAMDGAPGFVAD